MLGAGGFSIAWLGGKRAELRPEDSSQGCCSRKEGCKVLVEAGVSGTSSGWGQEKRSPFNGKREKRVCIQGADRVFKHFPVGFMFLCERWATSSA